MKREGGGGGGCVCVCGQQHRVAHQYSTPSSSTPPSDNTDEVVDAGSGVVLVEHAPGVHGQLHGGVNAAGDGAPLVDLSLHCLTA